MSPSARFPVTPVRYNSCSPQRSSASRTAETRPPTGTSLSRPGARPASPEIHDSAAPRHRQRHWWSQATAALRHRQLAGQRHRRRPTISWHWPVNCSCTVDQPTTDCERLTLHIHHIMLTWTQHDNFDELRYEIRALNSWHMSTCNLNKMWRKTKRSRTTDMTSSIGEQSGKSLESVL